MKTKSVFIIVSLILFSVCNSRALIPNKKGIIKKESFSQQYKVSTPLNLSVSTTAGNISVESQKSNIVDISFIVRLESKVLDITYDQLKEYADVEIKNDNSRLAIDVKRILVKNVSIGFSIQAPANTSATLKTSGGNISIVGLDGLQKLSTNGGNINMDKIAGSADVQTLGGNIKILNSTAGFVALTHGGNIALRDLTGKPDVSTYGGSITGDNISNGLLGKTKGGNIQLSNLKGVTDVSTAGGNIKLHEISGSVKAVSRSGNISATIIKLNDKLELSTSAGSIDATIPKGLGLNLNLSADNIDTPLSNFKGTAKKEHIIGALNGGGITVSLLTSAGNIVLNYK